MAQKTNTFEGGTEDATITTGNSGGSSGDAFDVVQIGTNAAVIFDNEHTYATRAAKISTGATSTTAYLEWRSLGSLTNQYGRIYLYLTTNPSAVQQLFRFETSTGASAGNVQLLSGANAGKIRIRDAASATLLDTTNVISLNQWVRIEWHVVHSATVGQFELKLFNSPDSTTATETLTSAADKNMAASFDRFIVGIGTNSANVAAFWLDNLVAGATSYPGPATTTVSRELTTSQASTPTIPRQVSKILVP